MDPGGGMISESAWGGLAAKQQRLLETQCPACGADAGWLCLDDDNARIRELRLQHPGRFAAAGVDVKGLGAR